MRSEGLTLVIATPTPLVVRPAASGRIEFRLRDEQALPVPYYPVDFSTVPKIEGGMIPARLSTDRALTDQNGSTVLQVITDDLSEDNQPAAFFVTGRSMGADEVRVEVIVTTNPYSVAIAPVVPLDLVGAGTIARNHVLFYADSSCGALDLANLAAAPPRPYQEHEVDPGASWVVGGVSGQGNHAVVGLGLDASGVVRIAGCLDLAGSSLLEDQTITATLLMDHLLPSPTGSYQVVSDIGLGPPVPVPQAVLAIRAAWQEWSRCPYDPARLWLDCTIDALGTTQDDPDDCMPVGGAEGPLGDQLDSRRGVAVPANATSAATGPTTPCHDRMNSAGNASLDYIVDGLFGTGTYRGQLGAMKLGELPSEIGALLSAIHLQSTMRISATVQPNSYIVDHDLTDIGFLGAATPVSFNVAMLGLPVTSAHGLLANLKTGQISIPLHGFTLRLGTVANFAFEASGLKSRGAADAASLVGRVFDLATFPDRGSLLTGCDALDAALSEQIKQPRGSLVVACRRGLDALTQKLSGAFGNLDGDGLDFFLQGTGSVPLVTGIWGTEIRSGLGSYSVSGYWSASSTSGGSH
jgi:hypothetical protein